MSKSEQKAHHVAQLRVALMALRDSGEHDLAVAVARRLYQLTH